MTYSPAEQKAQILLDTLTKDNSGANLAALSSALAFDYEQQITNLPAEEQPAARAALSAIKAGAVALGPFMASCQKILNAADARAAKAEADAAAIAAAEAAADTSAEG